MENRQGSSGLAFFALTYVQRFTPISKGIPTDPLVRKHIDRLVTFYYDCAEVAVHIRTKLKVPARG